MQRILEEFDFIKINLASPDLIKRWAERILIDGTIIGEIKKTDTINYRTFKPEMDGLFCERIFGPIKSGECSCGRHKHARKFGFICEVCGVEITDSRVRRHRMGYIKLLSSVTHVWYLKGSPSYIALILKSKVKDIEETIYFNEFFDYRNYNFDLNFLTSIKNSTQEEEKKNNENGFSYENFFKINRKKHGAEIIEESLSKINLKEEIQTSRFELININKKTKSYLKRKKTKSYLKKKKIKRRIRILESFLLKKSSPSWMVLSVLPVIPPGLRPMIQLEGGRFATSDLNELYRKIIMRNNRLGKLFEIDAPDVVVRNEKRLLQEAVDALIDNGRRGDKILDINNRPFKSLSDALEGKYGRFRQNLLGKRVDYSGRSVITVGPKLQLHQCGLPYDIAIELFKPFLIYEIIEQSQAASIRGAQKIINTKKELIVNLLKKIFRNHPIILNRAPTLHRLGVQAFEPILINGRAISLHPLVCPPFNADFDGDQMAVHIPLSLKARAEAISLLYAPCNFISPATGSPILTPTQDMVLGFYYLTTNNFFELKGSSHYFSSPKDALLAYQNKNIDLHSLIWLRFNGYLEDDNTKPINILNFKDSSRIILYKNKQVRENKNGKIIVTYIRTTVGRILFNKIVNESLNINF
jgi:DNA-directed RNA polymerase subunit beta'